MGYRGIGAGGLLIVIQVIMLVLYYGTNLLSQTMPWWVLWLPSLVILGVIVLAIIGFVIIIVAAAVLG